MRRIYRQLFEFTFFMYLSEVKYALTYVSCIKCKTIFTRITINGIIPKYNTVILRPIIIKYKLTDTMKVKYLN